MQTQFGFNTLISWSGLDIGRDRGSPVSHYAAPFEFTGRLLRVTVVMRAHGSSGTTIECSSRFPRYKAISGPKRRSKHT